MEIKVGNLTSQLITDNPQLIEALYQKYGYLVPGHNYIPSVRRRQWDGKIRYFKKNGTFRTGILNRIIADLELIGCKTYKLISEENMKLGVSDYANAVNVKNYEYRDYQKEAIEHSILNKRCILESPVASGKTLIAAGIVQTLNKKTVILFREKGILNQTYKFFKKCGIKELGINSGEGYIDGKIMLSTVQSIDRILDTHLESAEVLIVDEAHQFCKGEVTVAAIEAFPNAVWRIAFTATPPSEKEDIHGRLTLEGAFGPVYSTRSTEDLIKDGVLAKPTIQIIDYSPSGVDPDIDYLTAYQDHITNGTMRCWLVNLIICHIVGKLNKSKTLILVKDLNHLNNIRDTISPLGIDVYTVEGKDSIEERYEVINKFIKDSSHSVLIGTNVMQTGISIDEITHMINARGLEGEIPTIQGLGRGLRTSETKKELMFFDFYDKVPYLETHSKKRIKHYKNLGFEINYVKL